MDLTPYVENLREKLAVAAEAGGDDARALAERLTAPLESAIRLMLLDALSAAADEITRELAPGSVELRLRSGEPDFVVTPAPADDDADPERPAAAAAARRATTARWRASTSACPSSSRPASSRPPPASGCPSTPGSSAPPPPRSRATTDRRPPARRPVGRPHRLGPLTVAVQPRRLTSRMGCHADLRHPRTDLGHDRPSSSATSGSAPATATHRRRRAPERPVQRRGRQGRRADPRRVRRRAPARQGAEAALLAARAAPAARST